MSLYQVGSADPALVYAGDWFIGDMSSDSNATTHGTRAVGSNVTFVFDGLFVAAYGTVDNTGVDLTWTIDDATPVRVAQPAQSPPLYRFPFFNTQLNDTKHTLVITSASDGLTLWLDYLTFASTRDATLSARSAPARITSAGSTPVAKSMPPGIIALAVVGSVLALAAAIALTVLLVQRRHRLRLDRPRKDVSIRECGFDILPCDNAKDHDMVEAVRIKFLAALRSPSRTDRSVATQVAQSSTVFTSVIFAPSSSMSQS